MKILFPGIFLCLATLLLLFFDAKSLAGELTVSSGFAIGLLLVCIYGAGYLLYRIVSMYNEYKTNIDYQ